MARQADENGAAVLVAEIRKLVKVARAATARQVNALLVITNFEVGRRIVHHEQKGSERARYGKGVLKSLSGALTAEFGRGFSVRNLELMRRFYLAYRDRLSISQTVSAISEVTHDAAPVELPSANSIAAAADAFKLSWSHYVFLIAIEDANERAFYEVEATNEGWSLAEIRRQFDSSLYERLALSRDKAGVRALAENGHVVHGPEDLLKDPYVLEFLGLEERSRYSESDLESHIISKMERFLLELGKGFLFEGRQRRFTLGDEHFYVDLVFYNRLLRCFVLIDLKIGRITHQGLGQMQMYVNYYDRHVKLPEEHPTVGILLCKQNREALVEITLPAEANVHAREYRLVLPSKAALRNKLLEWSNDEGVSSSAEET